MNLNKNHEANENNRDSNINEEKQNVSRKEDAKKVNINFFKKLKISIFDFDKYYEIAGESFKRTIIYLAEIFVIYALVVVLMLTFKMNKILDDYNIYKESNTDVSSYSYEVVDGLELKSNQLEAIEKAGIENMFLYLWISSFIVYFITGLINSFAISVIGIITKKFISLPLKYSAVYAISVSAITLPTILQLIYIVVNFYTGFTMQYFQVMYLLIAYIYILAGMIMLKNNILKKKIEIVAKIGKNKKEDTKPEGGD